MKKTLHLMAQDFHSSTANTRQFLGLLRTFRKEMAAFLRNEHQAEAVEIKKGHFDIWGFFSNPSGIWYFETGDLRLKFIENRMLIRTAESFRDYKGGCNHYASTRSEEEFRRDFARIIDGRRPQPTTPDTPKR